MLFIRGTQSFAFFLLSAVIGCMTMLGCSFDYGEQAPPPEGAPVAIFENYVRRSVTGGRLSFEARAARAEYYDNERKIVLTGVGFSEFDPETGRVRSRGESDTITYRTDTGDAEADGFITIQSEDEDVVFETDYLAYNGALKTLEGRIDRGVLVKMGDGSWFRGNGFFGDTQQRSFTLREGVQGFIAGDIRPGSEE